MSTTFARLQQTPRRLGVVNTLGLFTYQSGCFSRTLSALLFIVAVLMGLRDYWIEKTAFSNVQVVKGVVTESDYTSWNIGGRDQKIIAFRYTVNGQTLEGFSYTLKSHMQVGKEVDIAYNPANPGQARIAGLDYAQHHFLVYGPFVLAFLFALLGIKGTLNAYRMGRLLERGSVAEAELLDRDTVKAKGGKGIWSVHFTFTDGEGQEHKVKTGFMAQYRSQGKQLVFYNPKNPQNNVFLKSLTFKLKLAEPGKWAPSSAKNGILGWFAVSMAFMTWALYLLAKLVT